MADDTDTGPSPPFATVDDLERRWHTLTEPERTQATELLADASEIIRNRIAPYPATREIGWQDTHRRGLTIICCQMVRTAMEQQVAGVQTGVTQSTETTGPFSNSYSWLSPDGYLRWNTDYLDVL
ncbi:hypothetical protein, partial [Bifidobacterium saimiriisciurei]